MYVSKWHKVLYVKWLQSFKTRFQITVFIMRHLYEVHIKKA